MYLTFTYSLLVETDMTAKGQYFRGV